MPTEPTERSLANLRPWKPGQSGNPLGKAGVFGRRVRHATRQGRDVLDFLLAVMRDEKEATRHRLQAASMLLERGFGRVHPADELPGVRHVETHNTLNVSMLSDADLEALHALVSRATAAADGGTGAPFRRASGTLNDPPETHKNFGEGKDEK